MEKYYGKKKLEKKIKKIRKKINEIKKKELNY